MGGQGSGDLCCLTSMGMVPVRGSINYEVRGSLGLAGYQTSVLHSNTCTGTQSLDSDGDGSDDCSAIAAFVASQDEANCPVSDGCIFTAKGGMRFPPNSVVVTVTDNDSAEDDSVASRAASAGNCRQTSLLQYTDSTFKINRKEWLTDWNCDSGDAGGLPGYPVANADGAA